MPYLKFFLKSFFMYSKQNILHIMYYQETSEQLLFIFLYCMLLVYIYYFPWVSLITVSHSTVSDLCSSSMGEFLSGLENSDWLKHIRSILASGIFVARVRHRTAFSKTH